MAATAMSAMSITPAAHAATAAELGPAILKDASSLVGSNLLAPAKAAGQSTSVATQPLAGFPRAGESFAILSTGKAADAYTTNSSPGLGSSWAGLSRGGGNDRDVTVLRLDLDVPEGVNCLTGMDFRFLSEEFPEYVNQGYNDAFIAELDESTWTASGTTISAPNNFAFDANGNVVSINAAGAATMNSQNALGTTYDGGTDLLTAATPITPGAHTLFLSIFDQGDDKYDSTVLVDNVRFGFVQDVATQCKPGAQAASDEVEETPEETPPAPEPTHVTAGPIDHTDLFGTLDDTYTIPETPGVTYLVDGQEKVPGTYPGTGTVTVVAQPKDSTFVLDGDTEFEVTFTAARAADLASSGVGRVEQTVTVVLPTQGSAHLVDGEGEGVTTLSTPQGDYAVTPATGVVTFLPAVGFSGTAPVPFRITERDGTTSDATYTPTVTKPAGPAAEPLTSHAATGVTQQVEVLGHDVQLLDGEGAPSDELAVTGQGTFEVTEQAGTHRISFTPETCFSGPATAVDYEVVDVYDQHSSSTYTPTVDVPAAPQPQQLISSGTGTEPQHVTAVVPGCGHLALVDGDEPEGTTVTRDGEGTYVLDPATGEITFTPEFGYSGVPAVLDVVEHDGHGNRVVGGYQVTVLAPSAPAPEELASTGVGTEPQSRTVQLRDSDLLSLLDGDVEVGEVVVEGQGTYLLDPVTGTISFVPASGFHGPATPVTYQVTDAYGQRTTATFTPTVELPAVPTPTSVRSRGPEKSAQQVQVDVPAGGTVALLDESGVAKRRIPVRGQGVYRLDPVAATITFTPRNGFYGKARAISFSVTDGYGQVAEASYQAVVARSAAVRLAAPKKVRSATSVPSTCRVVAAGAVRCVVTAYGMVDGQRTVVGTGRVRLADATRRLSVPVALNAVGRALAARPGGFKATLSSVTRLADGRDFSSVASTQVVARSVQLRPIYFATDSAALSNQDRRYLLRVRSQLGSVVRVLCTGFTDARSTVTYNASLGRDRARTVCAVLTKGVRATVSTVTKGETRPVAGNDTERGRALNRRVDVTLRY